MNDKVILKPKVKEDNMTTFSIRIEKELAQKYADLSYKTQYSRNELISIALKHYMNVVKVEEIPETKSSMSDEANTETSEKSQKTIKKKIPVDKDKK